MFEVAERNIERLFFVEDYTKTLVTLTSSKTPSMLKQVDNIVWNDTGITHNLNVRKVDIL